LTVSGSGYLGGVGVPVASCGGDPGDGGGGMEVEYFGEDGSGDLAGELHERRLAGGHGWDAETAEALAEPGGV